MLYETKLAELKQQVSRLEYIKYTLNSLIYWDKITYMPKDGIQYRSKVMSFLADEQYKLFSGENFIKLVDYFDGHPKNDRVTNAMVGRIKRNSHYVNLVPEEEYADYIQLIAVAEQVWENAKAKDDFQSFQPYLEKIVATFRKFAEYWKYEDNPYDALMGYYEEGLTVKFIDETIVPVKNFLIEMINRIKAEGRTPERASIDFSADAASQQLLWQSALSKLGFDFNRGRIDLGAHPTILASSPFDVRIVNTYDEKDLKVGFSNVLHSAGKGIYQQSIDPALLGTFLAEVPSFVMEESIGRLYENIFGRSRGFCDYFIEDIQTAAPQLKNLTAETLYERINELKPSPVRMEADELTYLLHIIIRYELERDLISGLIEVKDLPQLWSQKYMEYLGVEPKNSREGVLQDIHWAAGYMGYFPCYFVSNLSAAQLSAAISQDEGDFDRLIARGEFSRVNGWLREHIYRHGAVYSSESLVEQATGEPLSAKYYIDYLRKKYSEVYKLNS